MTTISYTPNTGTQTETIEQIMTVAKLVNGQRRNRILFLSDVEDLMDAIDQHPDAKTIRSYSKHGFVANSYKWRAEIVYCQATKNDNDSYDIVVRNADAKRSFGAGALVTIDGRGK